MLNKIKKYFSYKDLINDSYPAADEHFLNNEEIVALQNVLLEILRDLMEVCEKNEIKPFLQGGTLLGKIRHNGFIPWDDDLDIGMCRKDYENFKKIFDNELSDKYILMGPGVKAGARNRFLQMFKIDSYYETIGDDLDSPKKIYIDIFPIDYAPNNRIIRFVKGHLCNLMMIIVSCVEYKKSSRNLNPSLVKGNKRNRINHLIRIFIGTVFSFRDLNKWYDKLDKKIKRTSKTNYATSATGRKHYLGETLPANVFFPLEKSEFCGVETWIPHNSETYLENLYGADYLEIPPESKREHHYVVSIKL